MKHPDSLISPFFYWRISHRNRFSSLRLRKVFLLLLLLALISTVNCQDRAEISIRATGECGPAYLKRKGINSTNYRSSIRFNPNKIQLVPKNPVIPGCIKIKAEGVEITKPVRNLIAEIEMRIGGSPDPNIQVMPCSKRIDQKVNQCPCAKLEGSCVFCDFCKQLKSQSSRVSTFESSFGQTHKTIGDECQCEEMQRGLYDIETEMCTPELEDVKDYIPPELQSNIVEKRPISMFLTVYLMDMDPPNPRISYKSALGRALLQRKMAQSTVACFLMGIDVNMAAPGFG